MNTAEWIIVSILAFTLFCFLVTGIVFLLRLIDLSKNVDIVVKKSQDIAEKTEDIVDDAKVVSHNVKELTSIGGIAKAISNRLEKRGLEVEVAEKPSSKKKSNAEEKSQKA